MAYQTISDRVFARAEQLNLDNKQIAAAARVSPQAVKRWRVESSDNIRPASLMRIAYMMNCSMEWLVTGHERYAPGNVPSQMVGVIAAHLMELEKEGKLEAVDAVATISRSMVGAPIHGGDSLSL